MNALMRPIHFRSHGALALAVGLAFLNSLGALDSSAAEKREAPPKARPASEGRKLFESRCAACHGLDGRGGERAPDIVTNPVPDETLREVIRHGIPRRGMPAFGFLLAPAELRQVMAFVQSSGRALAGAGAHRPHPAALRGNPQQGEALFFGKAGCADCHSSGGKGGFLGTDLSGYGRRHAPGTIRDAILNPNRDLSPEQETVVATTRDGQQLLGLARNEDNFSVQLLDTEGHFHFLMKSDLADLKREPRSLMPADYATRLSPAELDDLVSYLVAGK